MPTERPGAISKENAMARTLAELPAGSRITDYISLTFALPVSFAAVRRRILNAINVGSGEKAWVKTLPLV
jgi:hypothetical protein